jgi:hypothetical protein
MNSEAAARIPLPLVELTPEDRKALLQWANDVEFEARDPEAADVIRTQAGVILLAGETDRLEDIAERFGPKLDQITPRFFPKCDSTRINKLPELPESPLDQGSRWYVIEEILRKWGEDRETLRKWGEHGAERDKPPLQSTEMPPVPGSSNPKLDPKAEDCFECINLRDEVEWIDISPANEEQARRDWLCSRGGLKGDSSDPRSSRWFGKAGEREDEVLYRFTHAVGDRWFLFFDPLPYPGVENPQAPPLEKKPSVPPHRELTYAAAATWLNEHGHLFPIELRGLIGRATDRDRARLNRTWSLGVGGGDVETQRATLRGLIEQAKSDRQGRLAEILGYLLGTPEFSAMLSDFAIGLDGCRPSSETQIRAAIQTRRRQIERGRDWLECRGYTLEMNNRGRVSFVFHHGPSPSLDNPSSGGS